GSGMTGDTTNLGNLTIGYNEPRNTTDTTNRTGSHTLIIGPEHQFTASGGLLAGYRSTVPPTLPASAAAATTRPAATRPASAAALPTRPAASSPASAAARPTRPAATRPASAAARATWPAAHRPASAAAS